VSWTERLAPREGTAAPRVALAFFAAAAVATILAPPSGAAPWVWVVVYTLAGGMVALSAAVALAPARWPRPTCTALAVAGLGVIVCVDLLTSDAGFTGQAVLMYPVLFAASQLRRTAAWALTGAAIAADAFLVLRLVPAGSAGGAIGYFSITVVTLTALLAGAGDKQEQLVAALRRQAAVDHLTGLMNRRNLDEAARDALTCDGAGTALILIDLDHFKTINDRHGHPVGDGVLQAIANAIVALCRKGDVASRIGGDELALLLPDCTPEIAARRAEEIVEAVRRTPLPLPDGSHTTVSVSVGYVHAPAHTGNDLIHLYAAADDALYLAKRRGRDQAACASP
jgi:diguanylate cyclase (GGDEF)-like protein